MTNDTGKRTLPENPNHDHLRKQAKALLAVMKTQAHAARLADAQFALARDYGFANWAALLAEVVRRAGAPRVRFRRLYIAGISPVFLRGAESSDEAQAAFFRAGVVAQIGFILTALAGVSMLFVTQHQLHAAHAVFERFAQLPHNIF